MWLNFSFVHIPHLTGTWKKWVNFNDNKKGSSYMTFKDFWLFFFNQMKVYWVYLSTNTWYVKFKHQWKKDLFKILFVFGEQNKT